MALPRRVPTPVAAPDPELAALGAPPDAIDSFREIPIKISVQLDRKRVRVANVLDFRVGSVIELSRSAGENVDLLMEGMTVGNGEIVVIEDTMGLRITDLRIPDDRGDD